MLEKRKLRATYQRHQHQMKLDRYTWLKQMLFPFEKEEEVRELLNKSMLWFQERFPHLRNRDNGFRFRRTVEMDEGRFSIWATPNIATNTELCERKMMKELMEKREVSEVDDHNGHVENGNADFKVEEVFEDNYNREVQQRDFENAADFGVHELEEVQGHDYDQMEIQEQIHFDDHNVHAQNNQNVHAQPQSNVMATSEVLMAHRVMENQETREFQYPNHPNPVEDNLFQYAPQAYHPLMQPQFYNPFGFWMHIDGVAMDNRMRYDWTPPPPNFMGDFNPNINNQQHQ